MDQKIKKAIEEYQCPGCINGHDITCFENGYSRSCANHCGGTMIGDLGIIFLGMPKGFNRLGACEKTKVSIFENFSDSFSYDFLNVPVWKFKDEHGNTLVRGLRPRTNFPFIHIFLEDCIDKIECYQITEEDLKKID